jgi:hypothetical protein
MFERGARYLTGDNLEVVWAEFSTLSWAVLFQSNLTAWHTHTATSRVENSAQVSSCNTMLIVKHNKMSFVSSFGWDGSHFN